jgi:hypothetical protein
MEDLGQGIRSQQILHGGLGQQRNQSSPVRTPSFYPPHLLTSFVSTMLHKIDGRYEVEPGLCVAREFGPSIRTILRCSNPLFEQEYRDELPIAARSLVKGGASVFSQIEELDFSDQSVPSSLIFVRPRSLAERHMHRLVIPTPGIARVLATAVIRVTNANQHTCFSRMSMHPSTRAAAGWIFENFMHARLTRDNTSVPGFDHAGQPCSIPTTTTLVPGTNPGLESSARDFYWRPGHASFPGTDAVLRRGTEIWVFRSTISCRHGSVEEGLQAVANRLGSHDVHGQPWCWYLVVVGSSREEAENWRVAQARKLRQSSESEWKELATYACELTFGPEDQSRADMFMSEARRFPPLVHTVAGAHPIHQEDPDFDVAET